MDIKSLWIGHSPHPCIVIQVGIELHGVLRARSHTYFVIEMNPRREIDDDEVGRSDAIVLPERSNTRILLVLSTLRKRRFLVFLGQNAGSWSIWLTRCLYASVFLFT